MSYEQPGIGEPEGTRPRMWGGTIAGFVLALLSPFCFGFLTGIPGLVLGIVGLVKCSKEPLRYAGKGLAIAAIAVGVSGTLIGTLIGTLLIIPAFFTYFTEGSSVLPFLYGGF